MWLLLALFILHLPLQLRKPDRWTIPWFSGFYVNSYVPVIKKVSGQGLRCYILLFEMIRVSSMLTGSLHLFALAANHWLGIIHPLKYKVRFGMVSRVLTVTRMVFCMGLRRAGRILGAPFRASVSHQFFYCFLNNFCSSKKRSKRLNDFLSSFWPVNFVLPCSFLLDGCFKHGI